MRLCCVLRKIASISIDQGFQNSHLSIQPFFCQVKALCVGLSTDITSLIIENVEFIGNECLLIHTDPVHLD